MNNSDNSAYIRVYSGKLVDLLNFKSEDVSVTDIAHALSNICRFTGHCSSFYSVAQHSVLVSNMVPKELALSGLMHDASEAYLSDVTRALKHKTLFGKYYQELEKRVTHVINLALDIPLDSPAVKQADDDALKMEQMQLFNYSYTPREVEKAKEAIKGWQTVNALGPLESEARFLNRWFELRPRDIQAVSAFTKY